jgi:hypothetical protein
LAVLGAKLTVHTFFGGMGFKHLTAFNLAMFGKHGWKLQTQPNCLVSRLFKAQYLPSSNYLDSKLDHEPIFVRRSIGQKRCKVEYGFMHGYISPFFVLHGLELECLYQVKSNHYSKTISIFGLVFHLPIIPFI